jgi:hypothetical protein
MVNNWGHNANGVVNTVLLTPNNHLLVGGAFTSINRGTANHFYVSLNPLNGGDDGYLSLSVSGHYVYKKVHNNSTTVYNQQLSPDGGHVLVEGVFTKVEGRSRQQIFMLNLGSKGNVSDWDSNDFHQYCADKHPFYIKSAAWSPDMTTVYVADTGFAPLGWNGKFPLTGLCDAVAAFPNVHQAGQTPYWVNYTGCDSLESVAADSSAVYVGGHERWADNQSGCNAAGSGAIPSPGMGGFTPGQSGGSLLTSGGVGTYSRARGLGADDMLVTSTGLWIASDNFDGSDSCGGVSGLAGICFLAYPG